MLKTKTHKEKMQNDFIVIQSTKQLEQYEASVELKVSTQHGVHVENIPKML